MVAQARGKERTSARKTAPIALFSAHQGARRWELTERETLLHTPEHTPSTIAAHFAAEIGTTPVSLDQDPPEQALAQLFPFHRAQTLRVCPWRQVGGQTVLLASDPDRARAALPSCRAAFGDVRIAITDPRTLDQAFAALYRSAHQIHAETATPAAMSCRNLSFGLRLPFAITLLAIAVLTAPQTVFAVLATIAILSLLPLTLLKLLALILLWRQRHPPSVDTVVLPARLPVITLLVPLFHERKIAAHLIQRLQRLDYPRPLTDIVLLLEEDDRTTRAALAAANLPRWMRLITVPPGTIQTKPRALNHGLTYARGSIIGIYDAEDAPEPDQLHQVARAFAAAPPDVACMQGILDFYNSRDNWLSRCFTLEYAVWFRAVLPALARIGWVVPLGGTTLFFRRLGRPQRHRRRGPRPAPRPFRLPDSPAALRHIRRGQLPPVALGASAQPMAQGLHDDLRNTYAASNPSLESTRGVEVPRCAGALSWHHSAIRARTTPLVFLAPHARPAAPARSLSDASGGNFDFYGLSSVRGYLHRTCGLGREPRRPFALAPLGTHAAPLLPARRTRDV
ncbi:MAG: glycosyltransferase [Marivivens sp.]|nr:glycosyltransferase [Marivivens sp.]